jgi:hypothetical protein
MEEEGCITMRWEDTDESERQMKSKGGDEYRMA